MMRINLVNIFVSQFRRLLSEIYMAIESLCILYCYGIHLLTKRSNLTDSDLQLKDARFLSRKHQNSLTKQTQVPTCGHFKLTMETRREHLQCSFIYTIL